MDSPMTMHQTLAPAALKPSDKALIPFVSVENMMRLVHRVGLETMLREIADTIEADFRRWETFDKTARIPAHSPEGVIELMPTADGDTYGFKYVNGHPRNMREGLQTVTAFGLLADMHTGYPVLLSEMTMLTALRTAAMSALAAKHLAPKGARVMAMIGTARSPIPVRRLQAIVGIETVRLWDSTPAATAKCARNLEGQGLTVVPCATAEEAILGAQIISTGHRRQEARHDPDRQHGRRRGAHQRGGRRQPRQDGARRGTSCCAPTSSWSSRPRRASRGDPAARARPSGDGALGGHRGAQAGPQG
jgi:ornithine cyclodeaminase